MNWAKILAPATLVAVLVGSTLDAWAGKRVALVVGNSAYENVPKLANSVNDAKAISQVLMTLGFEVTSALDLSKSELERAIQQFGRVSDGAEAALFFYAGHGNQVNGKNYLFPIDSNNITTEKDLPFETIDMDLIIKQMESGSRISLVFIDACRDNGLLKVPGGRGLAIAGMVAMESGVGTLIAYSTQPGNVALDGTGKHSPFADALLHHIETPGLSPNDLMIRVRKDVYEATQKSQVPWDHSSLMGTFYFVPPPRPSAPTTDSSNLEKARSAMDRGNYVEAADLFLTLSLQGNPEAMLNLGRMYNRGRGIGKNYAESVRWWKAAADLNLAMAQFNVGYAYEQGEGVEQDYAEALRWYELAAKQGLALAQLNYGVLIRDGKGREADRDEAARWFKLSAEQGIHEAQLNIGYYYAHDATPPDYQQAVHWYKKSAEQGNETAQYNLSNLYYRGEGVPQDYNEAARWAEMSAASGYASAQNALGAMYRDGYGVNKDQKEAVRLFELAAAQKNPWAQYNLACQYETGDGFDEPDFEEAEFWYGRSGTGFHQRNLRDEADDAGDRMELMEMFVEWFDRIDYTELSPEETERRLDLSEGQILSAQRTLKEAGHYAGAEDGKIGPKTRAAITKWQQEVRQPATGFLTSIQLYTLYDALDNGDNPGVWYIDCMNCTRSRLDPKAGPIKCPE